MAGGEDLANFAANLITRAQGCFAWAAAMLMAQAGHTATALHGGPVLLVGWYPFPRGAEVYQPAGPIRTVGAAALGPR